jgi:hypothetical protein
MVGICIGSGLSTGWLSLDGIEDVGPCAGALRARCRLGRTRGRAGRVELPPFERADGGTRVTFQLELRRKVLLKLATRMVGRQVRREVDAISELCRVPECLDPPRPMNSRLGTRRTSRTDQGEYG